MDTVISIEGVSKYYQLGSIGNRTLYQDLNRWWAKMRGKSDPLKKIGEADHGNYDGGYIWALCDINLKVQHGEVLGIIGYNGAGKSTLLKILSEVTAPTAGMIKIKGRIASLLEVGTGFHPDLTGRENIYMNGAILGMTRYEIKKKFDEIVEFSGLDKFVDTPVKRYSSGMYIRLAFAVAAHLESEILLVDEVLAVGDLQFQKKCLGKMEEISTGGRTVLFVSHNMPSIRNLCQRVIFLNAGVIEKDGPSTETINYYIARSHNNQNVMAKWDIPDEAPGNRDVKLHSIYTVFSKDDVRTEFTTDQDIVIKIKYWNFKKNEKYMVNVNLKSSDGLWVFTSINAPSANIEKDFWFEKPYHVGLYQTTCIIPANLLNSNRYFVYIAIVYQSKKEIAVQIEDVISFDVYDIGEMSKEYTGPWLGPVRPKLSWNTILIDD